MYRTVENVKPTFSLFHDNFPHFRTKVIMREPTGCDIFKVFGNITL